MLILGILLVVSGAAVFFMFSGLLGLGLIGGGLFALIRFAMDQTEGPKRVPREYGGSGQSTYNLSSKRQPRR